MIRRVSPVVVVAVGLAALLVCAGIDNASFLRFYLWAYLFWLGIALGSLGIVMMHHLTGGAWGFVLRRICEAAMATLPLLAVLFLPILLGAGALYPWATPERVAADETLRHRAALYTLPWFWGRSVIYLAVWSAMAFVLRRWSLAQDRAQYPAEYTLRFQIWCGPGLVAYVVTMSLAAIDWVMSLEPRWSSTIFGLLMIAGQGVSAFAFASMIARFVSEKRELAGRVAWRNWHDVGNLLLSLLLLWAYMAFSQYLISWNGNRTADAVWYQPRQSGFWGFIAVGLIGLHFALPFFLLLFGGLKRRPRWLAGIACLVLAARLLDDLWTVLPSFYPGGLPLSLHIVVLPIALGAIWWIAFRSMLDRAPLLPMNDPRLVSPASEGTKEG